LGKKYRNLFDKIVDIDNLRDAYKKALKGGNRYSSGHLKFKENLEANLYILQQKMINETYKIGEYYSFLVYEPKKRIINSLPFRDRVVQHAINNVIEPIFEKTFYSTSYACRKNKGTHKGINKVQSTLRKMKKAGEVFFLKMDFSKYFHSIYSNLLKQKIQKKITDRKTLRLIFKFICEKGVMIGNLLSQLFANIYGHIFDAFIKTKLRIKHYFRYMDDTVILSHSKEELTRLQKVLNRFINLYMKLKFSKWFIQKADVQFINFLGMRIKSTFKLIRKDSVTRARRHIKRFIRLKLFEKLRIFLSSWLGHVVRADSFNLLNLLRGELEYARAN
jgi:retron-type reverse transcriptase